MPCSLGLFAPRPGLVVVLPVPGVVVVVVVAVVVAVVSLRRRDWHAPAAPDHLCRLGQKSRWRVGV